MNKEIFRLPLYTLIAGFILGIINLMTIRILISGTNEWTLEMGTTLFYIQLILSIVAFVIIGILLRKKYNRTTFFKSATLLVIYSVIVLLLEQIMHYLGSYNLMNSYLYLPVSIFTIITSLLARIGNPKHLHWLHVIPSLLAPYLFLLFSKNPSSENTAK
jgi:hypothetical protein